MKISLSCIITKKIYLVYSAVQCSAAQLATDGSGDDDYWSDVTRGLVAEVWEEEGDVFGMLGR